MSIERNKEIAHRLVEGFSADGDIDATFALLREDAVWTVMAHPESFRLSGGMPKEQFIDYVAGAFYYYSDVKSESRQLQPLLTTAFSNRIWDVVATTENMAVLAALLRSGCTKSGFDS